jgi:hypothetical protein
MPQGPVMRAQWKNTGPFLVGGKINLPWNIIVYDLTARLFRYTTNIRKLKRNKGSCSKYGIT